MPFPLGAALGIGSSLLGGLFGKKGGPSQSSKNTYSMMDPNLYGYTSPQRGQTRDTSHQWLQNMFSGTMGGDPGGSNRFWNGGGAPGMSAGGGGSMAHGASSSAALMRAQMLDRVEQAKVAMGLDDPTYSFTMDPNQEERLLQRSAEQTNAATTDQWRQMKDELTMGGDATSPAAMKMRESLARQNVRSQADTLRDVRSDWFGDTRNLRHGWNELATGVNVQNTGWENQRLFGNQAAENQARAMNAQNQTQVGMANAGNATSASMANAGNSLGWASLDFDKHRFMWDASQDVLRPNAQQQIVQTSGTQSQNPGFWGGMSAGAQFGGDMMGLFGRSKSKFGAGSNSWGGYGGPE